MDMLHQFQAFIGHNLTGQVDDNLQPLHRLDEIHDFLLREIAPFQSQIVTKGGLTDVVMQALCHRLLEKFGTLNVHKRQGVATALLALAPFNFYAVQEQALATGLYTDYCAAAFRFRHHYPVFNDAIFNYFWQLLHKRILDEGENMATFMRMNLPSTDTYFWDQCVAVDKFCVDYGICPPVELMNNFYKRDSRHFRKLQQMFGIK